MRFETKAIRVGQDVDPATGAVITPIYQSTTFKFQEVGRPDASGFEYSRSGNPTRRALEQCIAALENAEQGLAFASGMCATDAVLSPMEPGDHVVAAVNLYGGTLRLFESFYKKRQTTFTYVGGNDMAEFEAAITPKTRYLWIETPTNPKLQLIDIAAVAEIGKRHGIPVVVDNTFASPYFQRPLDLGASVVLHSTTKYIAGHSDVIGGAVVTNDPKLHEAFYFYQNTVGGVPSPFDCYLSLRGLKTLSLRMRAHEANALQIAKFLEGHPLASDVCYPGLPSHPQHELAKRQMDGFGGMVTFELKGGRDAVNKFIAGLEYFFFAESLGGVESLVCHPPTMSHAVLTEAQRAAMGITDGTIRLSVGIENGDDLVEDLAGALERTRA